jgi:hypothetical protein
MNPERFRDMGNRSVNHQACGGYAMEDIRLLHRTSTQADQPFAQLSNRRKITTRAAGIESKGDIRAALAINFYFGCEADDRTDPMGLRSDALPAAPGVQLRLHAL